MKEEEEEEKEEGRGADCKEMSASLQSDLVMNAVCRFLTPSS